MLFFFVHIVCALRIDMWNHLRACLINKIFFFFIFLFRTRADLMHRMEVYVLPLNPRKDLLMPKHFFFLLHAMVHKFSIFINARAHTQYATLPSSLPIQNSIILMLRQIFLSLILNFCLWFGQIVCVFHISIDKISRSQFNWAQQNRMCDSSSHRLRFCHSVNGFERKINKIFIKKIGGRKPTDFSYTLTPYVQTLTYFILKFSHFKLIFMTEISST